MRRREIFWRVRWSPQRLKFFSPCPSYTRESSWFYHNFINTTKVSNKQQQTKSTAPMSQRDFTYRFRHKGDKLNQFEFALHTLAFDCEFGTKINDRLRDQFILGIDNDKWQLELLRTHAHYYKIPLLTLQDVIKSASLMESIETQQTQPWERLQGYRAGTQIKFNSKQLRQNSDQNTVICLYGKTQCL